MTEKQYPSTRSRPESTRGVQTTPRVARAPAFTLTELLVALGIIIILLGLLFPVLSRVRAAGDRTKSQTIIQNIATAVEAYHAQFRSYPGAYANANVKVTTTPPVPTDGPTSSENLLLSLMGGLFYNAAVPAVQYDPNLVGTGPRDVRNATGKQYPPLIEGVPRSEGSFSTADTIIPEFLDGYGDALPVLYMRANIGNKQAASEDLTTQYDARELYPYTQVISPGTHGLRLLGSVLQQIDKKQPNDVIPYLRSPTVVGEAGPDNTFGTADDILVPRQGDGFILIGAGPDRIYGTADDLTNFGEVIP